MSRQATARRCTPTSATTNRPWRCSSRTTIRCASTAPSHAPGGGCCGWGEYKIRTALQRKATRREVIDAALAQADQQAMGERLAQQLARKTRTVKYASPYELKTKLIRYGLSLGYDYEAVLDTASFLVKDTDSCNEF